MWSAFKKLITWEVGRQHTGYRKLKIGQGKTWDCYLIDYPADTHIPVHTDPVFGFKHYRLNIVLWGADNFIGETLFSTKRMKFFRSDIMPHAVNKVTTRRVVLSIGWIKK